MNQLKTTFEKKDDLNLPLKWYIRLGKMDGEQEIMYTFSDLDMLIAQQEHPFIRRLLSEGHFSEELNAIRVDTLKEYWREILMREDGTLKECWSKILIKSNHPDEN